MRRPAHSSADSIDLGTVAGAYGFEGPIEEISIDVIDETTGRYQDLARRAAPGPEEWYDLFESALTHAY